jgi:hypothetical protein
MKSRVHRGLKLDCKLLGFVSISSFFLWQYRVLFFFKCVFILGFSFVIVKMMTLYTYDLTTTFVRMHARGWLTTKKHRSGRLFLLTFFIFCCFFLFLVTFVNYFFIVASSLFVIFYYFFIACNFHKLFFTIDRGQGNRFIIFIQCWLCKRNWMNNNEQIHVSLERKFYFINFWKTSLHF